MCISLKKVCEKRQYHNRQHFRCEDQVYIKKNECMKRLGQCIIYFKTIYTRLNNCYYRSLKNILPPTQPQYKLYCRWVWNLICHKMIFLINTIRKSLVEKAAYGEHVVLLFYFYNLFIVRFKLWPFE